MARIALKVDVDTLRGTREGVPLLLDMLARHRATATFLFSLGPDHTGWALRRVFRPGFLSKVSRTSVVKHYGWRTLMYGVLLPAPDIGRLAAAPMRAAREHGHECGLHSWDHVVWHDNVRQRDAAWTRRQMGLAYERFSDIFGAPPAIHGAAGWQMNAAALRQLDDWGFACASDGREARGAGGAGGEHGAGPHRLSLDGVPLRHVQLPTTLPTLDELIGADGLDESNVHERLLALTASDRDQVFTLHAELEGGLLAPVFERLLQGWAAQGHELVSLTGLLGHIDTRHLPVLPFAWGSVAGRSGELVLAPAV